jgi:thiamine biosynthesis lipoprotein
MGMPICVEILDAGATRDDLEAVYAYFAQVDEIFSPFRGTSEVSRLNRGQLSAEEFSDDLRTVLALCEQTRQETDGYFDITREGVCDPSGLVKGWAIQQAAMLLTLRGWRDFYVDAGGDAQISGINDGRPWRVGIRNPFNHQQHVKVLAISDLGVATSRTAISGQHIYDPHQPQVPLLDIAGITVIGPNVYEADRSATAAFAMRRRGIQFVEARPELEGYMIDVGGHATYTSGFERYVVRA